MAVMTPVDLLTPQGDVMNQRMLVISGINGDAESLIRLQSLVRDKRPDGLLFAGGTCPTVAKRLRGSSPKMGIPARGCSSWSGSSRPLAR